jgi:hypothetical protein
LGSYGHILWDLNSFILPFDRGPVKVKIGVRREIKDNVQKGEETNNAQVSCYFIVKMTNSNTPDLSTLKTYPIDALLMKFSGLGYQNLMLVRRTTGQCTSFIQSSWLIKHLEVKVTFEGVRYVKYVY